MILGERFKGGVFRPSAKVLRYSQITGALKSVLGLTDLHAVGVIDSYSVEYIIYSPQDKLSRRSKIPLMAEVLTNVEARVYVASAADLPDRLELTVGALKNKGFGVASMNLKRILNREEILSGGLKEGRLATRLPFEEEIYNGVYGIVKIYKPIHGYMFKSISITEGIYVKAVMEGSKVRGPDFLSEVNSHNPVRWEELSYIDIVVEKIRQDRRFKNMRFSSKELNELAEAYERYGPSAAKLLLLNKMERVRRSSREYNKLNSLLYLVNFLKDSGIQNSIAAYIIKKLKAILEIRRW